MATLRNCGWRLALLGIAGLVGCGASEGEGTVAVTGTVTHKGSPVGGAIVSYVPAGQAGQSAVGVTDSAGTYLLTTRKKDDGAIPGQYKVSISKFEGAAQTSGGGEAAGPNGEMPASYTGQAADAPPPKNLLPAKYASADSSGFSAEVKSGSPNKNDFDLKE